MVDQISEDKFEDKVIKSDKPVIVDFYADWCGPCKMMAPVMEELSEEYGSKMSFFKCDVDANGGIAQKYNIMSIPAIFIFIRVWLYCTISSLESSMGFIGKSTLVVQMASNQLRHSTVILCIDMHAIFRVNKHR